MSKWREKQWRIPYKDEVVRDSDGNIGIVTGSMGNLVKRRLWINNVNGTEIYSDADAELFMVVSLDESKKFNVDRLKALGFRENCLCSFRNNNDVPLELLHVEWNELAHAPLFVLRDLRKIDENIVKTNNECDLKPFDLNLPPLESFFSSVDSNLKYRLEINLVEISRDGWAGVGSPWEFMNSETAMNEVENWKSRLKIRRIMSVINANWEITFPCWTISMIIKDQEKHLVVKTVDSLVGCTSYFPTALHAATALKLLPEDNWKKSLTISTDLLY